jgi:hypothetical protein
MSTFFKSKESNDIMHDVIHQLYGKKAKLFKNEYMVHFDVDLVHNGNVVDYIISAGKCIHIAIRSLPTPELWERTCKILNRIFITNPHKIREFLRPDSGMSLILRKDAIKWFGLAEANFDADPIHTNTRNEFNRKRISVNSFTQKTIISIMVVDKETSRSATVEITNGNIFEAQGRALKQIYGELFEL